MKLICKMLEIVFLILCLTDIGVRPLVIIPECVKFKAVWQLRVAWNESFYKSGAWENRVRASVFKPKYKWYQVWVKDLWAVWGWQCWDTELQEGVVSSSPGCGSIPAHYKSLVDERSVSVSGGYKIQKCRIYI